MSSRASCGSSASDSSKPGGAILVKVSQSAARIVFENRAHDFPQRILYWREGDALIARIEGEVQGQTRSRQWRFEPMK